MEDNQLICLMAAILLHAEVVRGTLQTWKITPSDAEAAISACGHIIAAVKKRNG